MPDAAHKTLGYRQTRRLDCILQHVDIGIIRSHQTQLPGKIGRFLSTRRAIELHICALVLRSSISLILLNVCLPKRHKQQRQQNTEHALGPELALGKGANTLQVPKRAQLQPETRMMLDVRIRNALVQRHLLAAVQLPDGARNSKGFSARAVRLLLAHFLTEAGEITYT